MRTLKLLLLAGVFSNALQAISVQEAISLALTKSHLLKQQQYLIEEAQYNVKIAQKGFYPQLNVSGTIQGSHDTNNDTQKSTSHEGKLQLKYNLFNGFQDLHQTQSKSYLLNAQTHQLETIKQDLIFAVKTAYIQLLQQKNQLLIAEESVKLLEQQRKETADFHSVGIVPKNDLLKVEVQLSNAKQNLMSAQSTLAYMKQDLERHIGEPLDIQNLQEVEFTLPTQDFEGLYELMLKSRSDLKTIDEQILSKKADLKTAQGGYYPIINLIGEQVVKDQPGTQSIARMEVTLNLFDGLGTVSQTEAARSNMLSLHSKISALKEDLRLQLFSAFKDYLLSINAYKVSKEALEQAQENYRIASNRYKERIETTSNFLDAEFLLTQAKTNVLLNHYGISLAIAKIIRITEWSQ